MTSDESRWAQWKGDETCIAAGSETPAIESETAPDLIEQRIPGLLTGRHVAAEEFRGEDVPDIVWRTFRETCRQIRAAREAKELES